ncbi:MAG: hydroxyacid dehydrogenase [Acidimicrobiales bacterium]|nr:hydroxyacid dehydrogenase [Acidimicrobiales bacterium]
MADRPRIALGVLGSMAEHLFWPEHLARLEAVGTVIDRRGVAFDAEPEAFAQLAEADILVGHWGCPTLSAELLDGAPQLRLFAYAAGTVKWQVTDAVFDRGIVVTSAASANARPVAEYTVAMILLANKGALLFAARERDPDAVVPLDPLRVGNLAKRVGIVGASHVGRIVIDLLAPYELEVGVYDPFLDDATAAAMGVVRMGLDELCAWCHVLSIHAPDVPATRHMIGADQLAALRPGATLINTARPALVDADALEAELRQGRIAAVLDVTEPEPLPADSVLRTLPNVVLTPHIAGAMGSEVRRLADLAVTEVERFVRGEPPLFPVTRADLDRIA